MNLEEAAEALATAIVGVGPETPPPRDPNEESVFAYRARRQAWQRRSEVCKALVDFGKVCRGDLDEPRERR